MVLPHDLRRKAHPKVANATGLAPRTVSHAFKPPSGGSNEVMGLSARDIFFIHCWRRTPGKINDSLWKGRDLNGPTMPLSRLANNAGSAESRNE
jgi:hypothetical protein